MTTKWSHLPNAKYIDLVLESLKSHPPKWDAARSAAWDAARDAAWDAARYAAWNAAWDAARSAAWDAARDAAWDAARSATYGAARGAILALIAYDDCAHLLSSNPEEVKILAKLGVPAAILLLPACIVFNETKE